jgi:hypothetical protein
MKPNHDLKLALINLDNLQTLEIISDSEAKSILGGDPTPAEVAALLNTLNGIFIQGANCPADKWNEFQAQLATLAGTRVGYDQLTRLANAASGRHITISGSVTSADYPGSAEYEYTSAGGIIYLGNLPIPSMSSPDYYSQMATNFGGIAHEIFHALMFFIHGNDPVYQNSTRAELDAFLFEAMANAEVDEKNGCTSNDLAVSYTYLDKPLSPTIYANDSSSIAMAKYNFANAWWNVFHNQSFTIDDYNALSQNFIYCGMGEAYNSNYKDTHNGQNMPSPAVDDNTFQSCDILSFYNNDYCQSNYTPPFPFLQPEPPSGYGPHQNSPDQDVAEGPSYSDGDDSSLSIEDTGGDSSLSLETSGDGEGSYSISDGPYIWYEDPWYGRVAQPMHSSLLPIENLEIPLTREGLVKLILYFFPGAGGFLLTGSQRNNSTFSSETDIDIVLLDPIATDVYAIIKRIDEYRIDITVVPLANIENMLTNEANDPKGVLMTMISNSEILNDKYSILAKVRNRAEEINRTLTNSNYYRYSKLLFKLRRIAGYYNNNLSEEQKIILLSDFVSLVTTTEAIRISNWASDRNYKITDLNNKDHTFIDSITTLFKNAINNNQFEQVADFIRNYCSSANVIAPPAPNLSSRLILDVKYSSYSFAKFIKEILPLIKGNSELKDQVSYFFRSPRRYSRVYKNALSVVFNYSENLQSPDLPKLLVEFFKNHTENFRYRIVYENNSRFDVPFFSLIEELRKSIVDFVISLTSGDEQVSTNEIEGFTIIIGCFLVKKLDLNNTDFELVNTYLSKRWMFSKNESIRHKSKRSVLYIIENRRTVSIEDYYNRNQEAVLNYCKQGVDAASASVYSGNLSNVFSRIVDVCNYSFSDVENNLSWQLFNKLGIENCRSSYLYETIMDQVFQMLNLGDYQKLRSTLLIGRGFLKYTEK